MKVKKKKAIFICRLCEGVLAVIKYVSGSNGVRKFEGPETETFSGGIDDKELPQKIGRVFKKLGYSSEPIVVSLPRSQATCRYLKIPSTAPREIEKILHLQASRYLPYQAEELITGYQLISTDNQGYADVNLVIVQRGLIERYLEILKGLKPGNFSIVLSSYGLTNLYNHLNPQEAGIVMVLDINGTQAELAIISHKKLILSRAFKINQEETGWKDIFVEEVSKTAGAYAKDFSQQELNKIIIFGGNKNLEDLAEILNKRFALPTEVLSYSQRLNLAENLSKSISDSGVSSADVIGLGIEEIPDSLNLLPQELKEATGRASGRKEKIRLAAFIAVIICIFALGLAKNLDNKSRYLEKLKIELAKVSQEAKPLEELTDRMEAIRKRAQKEFSSLDIIYELHKIMPDQLSLISIDYEENGAMILRGQAAELDSVFTLVAQMEESEVFKKFNVKVRYATKKRTAAGEITDFEILCLRK